MYGIGNIYADEALWAAKVYSDSAASSLSKPGIWALIDAAREVMAAALAKGGTSFDSLYVDVSGVARLRLLCTFSAFIR